MKSPKPSEKSPVKITDKPTSFGEAKKFARPNSLALKPTTASMKQHHGLTPTMFNQILISPDTPRVAKKYVQQFLHGNYFSYLGLKCSTKPVYCTLNKTQPFYVPHFKKLSMYSEWRQQDTKTEKLYLSAYDSRQRHQRYSTAGKTSADLVVHSSYKVQSKRSSFIGGFKSLRVSGGYIWPLVNSKH
jgi:HIV type I enhancer-binding protein